MFRDAFLVDRLGEYLGHVLSTALLVGAILLITFLFFTRSATDYTQVELVLVGVGWVVLTTGFEFLVGSVDGTPVSETLGQYVVLAREVWIAVPLALLVAPLLFGGYLAS